MWPSNNVTAAHRHLLAGRGGTIPWAQLLPAVPQIQAEANCCELDSRRHMGLSAVWSLRDESSIWQSGYVMEHQVLMYLIVDTSNFFQKLGFFFYYFPPSTILIQSGGTGISFHKFLVCPRSIGVCTSEMDKLLSGPPLQAPGVRICFISSTEAESQELIWSLYQQGV